MMAVLGDEADQEVLEFHFLTTQFEEVLNICHPTYRTVLHINFKYEVDEPMDISGKAQLLAYVRFIREHQVISLCAAVS
jgi:hypothetical protein